MREPRQHFVFEIPDKLGLGKQSERGGLFARFIRTSQRESFARKGKKRHHCGRQQGGQDQNQQKRGT